MTGVSWTWEWLGRDGSVSDGPLSPVFTTRFDAELWLGQVWRRRAADGLSAARLTRGDARRVPAATVTFVADHAEESPAAF